MPPRFSTETKHSVSFEAEPSRDQPKTSPCEASCPAGHAIQRTIYLIQNERFEEALENIWAKHPFPGLCGRACFHPCETPCNRQFYDEAISVRALERAAFDLADWSKVKQPRVAEDTGKRVAIIGSGPAGLTCAYFSALFGHGVTVFEAMPALGGMARYGIPDHRLPKDVVDREVNQILKLGVEARPGTRVGEDISFEELGERFDACVIAAGAWKEKRLDIPGNEKAMTALPFLEQVSRNAPPEIGEKVLILGGGGVAFDVAGTALRLGAKEVHVACVEPRDQMPAPEEDIRQAEGEGVIIHNSRNFLRIIGEGEKVSGVACEKIASFSFDEAGMLDVDPEPDSEHDLEADTVIMAVGVAPDFGFLGEGRAFGFTEKGALKVDAQTMATGSKGVFAAGDAVTGPGSVAEAIGTGRRAAIAVHCFLTGMEMADIRSITVGPEGSLQIQTYGAGARGNGTQEVIGFDEVLNPDYYERANRVPMAGLSISEAVKGSEEIFHGYTRDEAMQEAARCFHCGHCAICGTCAEICPLDVIAMGEEGPEVVYPKECWHCGGCRINCPCGAVYYEFPLSMLI